MNHYILKSISIALISLLVSCSKKADIEIEKFNPNEQSPPLDELYALDFANPFELNPNEGSGVKVKLISAWKDEKTLVIKGEFKPLEKDFHFYSKDKAMASEKSPGYPLRMDPTSKKQFRNVELIANKKPIKLKVGGATKNVEVYKNGPVSLFLVLEIKDKRPTEVPLTLTYMLCDDVTCKAPVINFKTSLKLTTQ